MSMYHRRNGGTPKTPSNARDERTLALLAVEERFIEELRAGKHPRLADYLRAYPALAEDLIAFASAALPEATLASSAAATFDTPGAALDLSPGTLRALKAIRADSGGQREPPDALLVAEERGTYAAPELGIEALARSRGISLEALAALVETTPEHLAPEALSHIADLLGVSVEEARQALADAFS